MTWSYSLIGLLLASGFTLGLACNGPSGSTSEGSEASTDTTCSVGSAGCACTGGGSCDPGLLCAGSICVNPDQGTTSDVTTTGSGPTTNDVTTGGDECKPNGGGAVDPACPAEQPYCLAGVCVDCGALDCAAVSPSLPLCDPDTGLCAACLCDDAAPVCDPSDNSCSKCDAHSDCPDSACDLDTGACLPAAATLWVAGGTCNDDGEGSKASPLCSLDEAFVRAKSGAANKLALRVKAGAYAVAGSLHVPAGRVLALVSANDNGAAISISSPTAPTIVVEAQAKLLLDGVELAQSGGDGIGCAQATMWLDRLVVRDAAIHGVTSDDCTVTMRRSVLVANATAGIKVVGGALRLENSFISSNGNYEVPGGGVYLSAGASVDAVYTTLVDNRAAAGNPFSIACDADGGKETVEIRNSVAINNGGNTLCDGASVTTSAWTTAEALGGNIAIDFPSLGSYLIEDPALDGVYRAIPGTALDDLAMWQEGDPRIDFDGDARPSGDNSPDFAGADRASM
ncbi:MAG: right-handed parallel beta-helix repeat-containing protein [Nannocystis sp.]|nr:right-handed parallel beta-helix repeat-containing protein [Nannocystis sp.]MBA3549171.1 right-handed parallel beta-helix repeat-containing protein [Nannocystis sp.]